jgi:hypothetical protein
LKQRQEMDSTNAGKPLCSDPPGQKAVRSQRGQSKNRRPGGQAGHAGHGLDRVADPDQVVLLVGLRLGGLLRLAGHGLLAVEVTVERGR